MAEEMGKELVIRQILFRKMPQKSIKKLIDYTGIQHLVNNLVHDFN